MFVCLCACVLTGALEAACVCVSLCGCMRVLVSVLVSVCWCARVLLRACACEYSRVYTCVCGECVCFRLRVWFE